MTKTDKPEKLAVTSPCDGSVIAQLEMDNGQTLAYKINAAIATQEKWKNKPRTEREKLLVNLSDAIAENRQKLIEVIVYDAGKTAKEAAAEVDGAADIIKKTIANATLPEFGGMARCKERPPVGIVGLITSFNFPLALQVK